MSSLQTPMFLGTTAVVEDGPFWPLLVTVFTSILEVFLLCLAGFRISARRWILRLHGLQQLNRLNVSLFTPSLLFSKVAFFLSPEKLRELWIIPIFFVLVTTVSMSVAFVLGWLFRVKRSQRNFAMAAAMFMNSNSLPIALMQSLVVTVHGLKWGSDDNKNAMVGRALTYLVLYSTLGMVLRWSYGVRLLAQADEENAENTDEEQTSALPHEQFPSNEGTLRPTSMVFPEAANGNSAGVHAVPVRPRPFLKPGHGRRQSRFYNSFPNSPNQTRLQLPELDTVPNSARASAFFASPDASDSESEGEAETAPLILPQSSIPPPTAALPTHVRRASRPVGHARQVSTYSQFTGTANPTLRRAKRRLYRAWVALNEFMTVPLWAAAASLIVACVGPLQHALDEHMQPIKGALTSAGNCAIPANPHRPRRPQPQAAGTGLGPSTSENSLLESVREMFGKQKQRVVEGNAPPARKGETTTVVIAVLSRMILTPILLLPLMALSAKFNLHAILDDPITQAASGDAFERLISRTIFWSYCVVTPPATVVYVTLGLMLSKL
ncbi:membrane transport protein-domain-containing protein [Mycena amicta]|nr:membrane transport protein-domain-containing protein [Mycena amicta]